MHIGYFINNICLPPADLLGTCHGISFYGITALSECVNVNVFAVITKYPHPSDNWIIKAFFLELGICSISAILESYICFRNFYTLKK